MLCVHSRDLVTLDKQLRELLRANPLNAQDANALRRQLIDAVVRLADTYPLFAAEKEVELALWKPCFYRRIEDFRRRIRKYAAAAQTERKVREHFDRVSNEFQLFLTEAASVYTHLRDVFATWLQRARQGAAVATDSSDAARCRQSLHRCYVFLGDLARYQELHSQRAKKNFTAAGALYYRALAVMPENGNPHNQLAVLATYVEAETVAVYRYCRSLLTLQPFTTAEENLALLFERSRQRPLAAPMKFTTLSLSSKEKSALLKSYLHRLTRMHGILFVLSSPRGSHIAPPNSSEGIVPTYPRDMEAVLFKDLRTLLHAGVVGDSLLLKIVVTNMFCMIRAADLRSPSSPIRDALRLSVRTVSCVMEFVLETLDMKSKAGTSSKSLKDSALSALRFLGPVAVFCQYLELHPDMLEQLKQVLVHREKKLYSDVATNEQGTGVDQFFSVFLETLAKLVNHARMRELYTPLLSDAGQQDGDMPFAVREQEHLLKESLELRGFTPLETEGAASMWQDDVALQTSATEANSVSQSMPLSDDEAARLRAWRLYNFAQYLCNGYKGDPLLFFSASGLFTTSPLVRDGNPLHANGMSDALASLDLGHFSAGTIQQQHSQPQGTISSSYLNDTGVDEDDDFDDEVIVFRPSAAFGAMANDQSTKPLGGFVSTAPLLDASSGGDAFSLRSPSPISSADDRDRDSTSSQSSAFGTGKRSFGLSLGYPSFNTFNGEGSLPGGPLVSGWENSAGKSSMKSNDTVLRNSRDVPLGMPIGDNNGLRDESMMPSVTSGVTGGAQGLGLSSHFGRSQAFVPMADLAAVEREAALYQQRTSSLSSFLSVPTLASKMESPSPSSSPWVAARPPPGFAAASMEDQQQQQRLPNSFFNP
uniref:DNA/RNA-binding domain-containing protein n=1 Tax=Hyaloperonospora arabidopsidis (strain Emoy2) TaxID=559515 RepID=M4BYS7_HYAAE